MICSPCLSLVQVETSAVNAPRSLVLLAVVDGTRQRRGGYWTVPDAPRIGLRAYAQEHPWIVAGAACGIAGVIVDFALT
jgi:hypothetical protein